MKTRIVRIGSSFGVRIPKALLEQAGLENEVELRVTESGIVIRRATPLRGGWAAAAAKLQERGEVGMLDKPLPTPFDSREWVWE